MVSLCAEYGKHTFTIRLFSPGSDQFSEKVCSDSLP